MSRFVTVGIQSTLRSRLVVGAALALLTVAAWAARKQPQPAEARVISNIQPGESKSMGNGTIWSWVKTDLRGRPTAVGISLTETALQNLPQNGGNACCEDGIALTLPSSARGLPFTHAVVNWNPNGRDPRPIYGRYDGEPSFVEPMISKAYLDSKLNTVEVIKTPTALVTPDITFPTRYTVRFDAESKVYTISLEGMMQRQVTDEN